MKEIQLTQGKVAFVDDHNYDWLNQWKWCLFESGNKTYAARGVKRSNKTKIVLMHRVVLGLDDTKIYADHKDGNGLNNQIENLRSCTNQENQRNRGANNNRKYKGVWWDKYRNKWKVGIVVSRRLKNIGRFDTEAQAALAYNEAALKYFGEFAWLNTITD